MALREDFLIQQVPEETANVLHRKLEQHKVTQHIFDPRGFWKYVFATEGMEFRICVHNYV